MQNDEECTQDNQDRDAYRKKGKHIQIHIYVFIYIYIYIYVRIYVYICLHKDLCIYKDETRPRVRIEGRPRI